MRTSAAAESPATASRSASAAERAHGEGDEDEEKRHDRPDEDDLPEAGVEDVRDDAPGHGFADREPARRRALEDERGRAAEGEERRGAGDERPELPTHARRGGAEEEEEGDHAAGGQEKRAEAREADDARGDLDRPRRALPEHLARDAGRLRAGSPDVEDPRALDRVRVLREDAPGGRVRAVGEIRLEADRDRLRRGQLDLARVHAVAAGVVDAQRSEGRLHGLVEDDDHPVRRLLDHGVVRGLGGDDLRVGGGVRGGGERCERRRETRERPPAPRGHGARTVRLLLSGR